MRWTALTDGNIFLRNHPEFKNMTASQLKDLIKEKPETLKKIMYMTSNLRGSRQYWSSRYKELKQMIEQLGLPTFFLTLSFADYHYEDLYRLLTTKEVSTLTERERMDLLQKNPGTVDAFFAHRVDTFLNTVSERYLI